MNKLGLALLLVASLGGCKAKKEMPSPWKELGLPLHADHIDEYGAADATHVVFDYDTSLADNAFRHELTDTFAAGGYEAVAPTPEDKLDGDLAFQNKAGKHIVCRVSSMTRSMVVACKVK